MLPIELIEHILPPSPNEMLAERLEMPMRRGMILLPHATKEYNRCHEAIILWGDDRGTFRDGEKVLISASAQLAVTFGFGPEERTIYVLTPSQVLMKLLDFAEDGIEKGAKHPLDAFGSRDHEMFEEEGNAFDEGDPAGLS